MTAFLIALIIFFVIGLSQDGKRNETFNNYKKSNTSKAAEQYKIACGIIEEMAEKYRYYYSILDPYDYKKYWYFKKHKDEHDVEETWKQFVEEENKKEHPWSGGKCNPLCKVRGYQKEYWDKFIGDYNKDESNLHKGYYAEWAFYARQLVGLYDEYTFEEANKILYKYKIWEKFDEKYLNVSLEEWKKKYPNFAGDGNVFEYLKSELLETKKYQQSASSPTATKLRSAYESYNNMYIIEKIAKDYGFPTHDELRKMLSSSEYKNVPDLARMYSKRVIKRQGYCPLGMPCITPHPTQEQINYVSGLKSEHEKLWEEIRETNDLHDKYPDF